MSKVCTVYNHNKCAALSFIAQTQQKFVLLLCKGARMLHILNL